MFPIILALLALANPAPVGSGYQDLFSYHQSIYDYDAPGAPTICFGPYSTFDGTVDYGGSSGSMLGPFTYSDSVARRLGDITNPQTLIFFVGTGTTYIRGKLGQALWWPFDQGSCGADFGVGSHYQGAFGQSAVSLVFRYWYNNSTQFVDVVPEWDTGTVLVTNLNGFFNSGAGAQIPQFNPALGTLSKITIRSTSMSYDATYGMESLSETPPGATFAKQLSRYKMWLFLVYQPS